MSIIWEAGIKAFGVLRAAAPVSRASHVESRRVANFTGINSTRISPPTIDFCAQETSATLVWSYWESLVSCLQNHFIPAIRRFRAVTSASHLLITASCTPGYEFSQYAHLHAPLLSLRLRLPGAAAALGTPTGGHPLACNLALQSVSLSVPPRSHARRTARTGPNTRPASEHGKGDGVSIGCHARRCDQGIPPVPLTWRSLTPPPLPRARRRSSRRTRPPPARSVFAPGFGSAPRKASWWRGDRGSRHHTRRRPRGAQERRPRRKGKRHAKTRQVQGGGREGQRG